MKTNQLIFGVHLDVDLASCSDSQLENIVEICVMERLVVLKNQRLSIERFNEINDCWGLHQPANIWANHPEFPKILRVTNKEVQPNKKGLFHGQELNWHCNGVFSSDPEECVSLWCINPGKEGATWFSDGVHAYSQLNDSIKNEIENASIFLTNEISKTYCKYSIYGELLPHEQKDLDKMSSRTRDFPGGHENNPYDKNISHIVTSRSDLPQGKKRRKDIEKKLVTKHPLSGQAGLYFPFFSVAQIKNLSEPSRSKEIFDTLVNSYVGPSGKIYKHKWEHGDIVLSDQVHSLHRREPYRETRELYRTAFYYKRS